MLKRRMGDAGTARADDGRCRTSWCAWPPCAIRRCSRSCPSWASARRRPTKRRAACWAGRRAPTKSAIVATAESLMRLGLLEDRRKRSGVKSGCRNRCAARVMGACGRYARAKCGETDALHDPDLRQGIRLGDIPPEQAGEIMGAYCAYTQKLQSAGVLVAGDELQRRRHGQERSRRRRHAEWSTARSSTPRKRSAAII